MADYSPCIDDVGSKRIRQHGEFSLEPYSTALRWAPSESRSTWPLPAGNSGCSAKPSNTLTGPLDMQLQCNHARPPSGRESTVRTQLCQIGFGQAQD